MKQGYSMLLADLVPADQLGYGDCSEFMVVCPVCKEGVFKALRKNGDRPDSHYLSHFHRDEASQRCELRISRMTDDEMRQSARAGDGKGQDVQQLIDRIQDVVVTCFTTPGLMQDGVDVREAIKETLRNPNFNWWFNEIIEHRTKMMVFNPDLKRSIEENMARPGAADEMAQTAMHYYVDDGMVLAGHTKMPVIKQSTIQRTQGVKFARAMVDHMYSQHGRETQRWILASIFALIIIPNKSNGEFISKLGELAYDMGLEEMPKLGKFDGMEAASEGMATLCTLMDTSKLRFMSAMKRLRIDKSDWTRWRHMGYTPREVKPAYTKMAMCETITSVLQNLFLHLMLLMPNGRRFFSTLRPG